MASKGIGGSDIAAIRGLNEYVTPFQVWQQKTGRKENTELSERQLLSLELEPFILEQGVKKINQKHNTFALTHEKLNKDQFTLETGIVCVPDAIAKLSYEDVIISIKNTSKDISEAEDVPIYWLEQINYELGILGLKTGILMWMVKGSAVYTLQWTFQDDLFEEQLNSAKEFWKNYVLTDTPPPPINEEDIKEMFPKSNGKSILTNEEINSIWKRLGELKNLIKPLEEEEKLLNEKIKLIMKDMEAVNNEQGKPLFTFKGGEEKPTFDRLILEQTYPDIYHVCMVDKPSPRKLLWKQSKEK